MGRTVTVTDTIRVQGVLQNVELQMEEIQGQLIYLRDRTAMSTISIAVHEAGRRPVPPAHAERPVEGRPPSRWTPRPRSSPA